MRLQADVVDLDTSRLKLGYERGGSSRLIVRVLDTVVIVVGLDVLSRDDDGLCGELVGEEEVLGSNSVVPDAGGESSVGVQCLVDYVPAAVSTQQVLSRRQSSADKGTSFATSSILPMEWSRLTYRWHQSAVSFHDVRIWKPE